MQTFTKAEPLVDDPGYDARRRRSVDELRKLLASGSIDEPIQSLIEFLSHVTHCYTLQSCYGHFAGEDGVEYYSMRSVSANASHRRGVQYRIAYIAFCIQKSEEGRKLIEDLRRIPKVDREYIQFGGARWFRNRYVNTYVLQVEPLQYAQEDSIQVTAPEAVRIELARDRFYSRLCETIGFNFGTLR